MKAQAVKPLIKPMFRMPAKEDYLKAALRVAHWFRANAERTEAGIHWFEDPMRPEGETVMGEFSVYSGMPGPILFLLELSEITGDLSWREEACLAAEYLLANFDEGRKMQTDMGVPGSEIGPISGTAGLSFVFTELGKATGEQKYLDFAATETEKIASLAKRIGEGVEWLGEPGGISYDAGIALYLLYEAKAFGREDWRALAILAARRLLEQAIETEDGAYKWCTITVPNIGIEDGGEMPNFFYGTAGTAYVLARFYEETGEPAFLEAAERGAAYIERICVREDEKVLTPFCLPNPEQIYFLGMCNGFAGTVKLFYLLSRIRETKVKKSEAYGEFAARMIDGIVAAGAPEVHFKGYWNVVCMCCGTASLLNALTGVYLATGERNYLELAERSGRYLLGQFTDLDEEQGCWFQSWHRIEPWKVDARIGYYDGNAGEAMQLLELYAALCGNFRTIRFPDDPFPAVGRAQQR